MRTVARLSASLLAATLLSVPVVSSPSAGAAAGRDRFAIPAAGNQPRTSVAVGRSDVTKRSAVLTPANRPAGFPTRSEPHLRLKSAEISLDLAGSKGYGAAFVEAAPPSGYRPTAFWSVGTTKGRTCEISLPSLSDAFFGSDYTNEFDDFPAAGWATADCAVVTLREPDEGEVVDAFVVGLSDELPRLKVQRPELIGSKKINLVKGVWTSIDVGVRNLSEVEATNVRVVGRGKGLKVRSGRVKYPISATSTGSASIRVKLVGSIKRSRLQLVAKNGAVKAKRVASVRRVNPPRRPASGSYRDKSGSVSFTVKNGTLRGFRVSTRTTCGTYLDFPNNTSQNTYDFPTTRIPRNGIVDRIQRGKLFTASLRLKVAGGKVTRGRFGYSGPNFCRAVESFTARRTN